MQMMLDGLTAVHDVLAAQLGGRSEVRMDPDYSNVSRAEHPVVRIHPETGEKCLFINPFFTSHIKELSPGESGAILGYLFSVIERPEFVCRWRWQKGDVAFWDNRCTMHAAVDDYGAAPRLAERVCIKGTHLSGLSSHVGRGVPRRA